MEPDDVDDGPFRRPPPPDDRLWRHPSELGAPPARRGGRGSWLVAAASGLTGAVLTLGVLAAVGLLDGGSSRPGPVVVRRAAAVAAPDADAVARVVEATAPSVVRLEVATGALAVVVGSGVVFRDDGHVLTNAHVVEGAEGITAVLDDGRTVGAHVVAVDGSSDIAVVRLDDPGPFRTALLGTTEGLAPGDRAIVLGSPAERGLGPAVVTGTITGVGRQLGPVLVDMIETDAAVTAGQSGGALVDRRGAVVGIVTALSEEGGGFAVPVDVARAVAGDLLHHGRVRAVWLGVRGETRDAAVHLVAVAADSPADAGGLRPGDVLRRVDGRPVRSMADVRLALRRHHPGDRLVVAYDRAGMRRSTVIEIAERPGA